MKEVEYILNVVQGKENFIGCILEQITRISKTNIGVGRINACVFVTDDEEKSMMRDVFKNLVFVNKVSFENTGQVCISSS